MSSYRLTDFPHAVLRDEYLDELERMKKKLLQLEGIESVYQAGGIHTPGISDLDLIAVFKEDIIQHDNPCHNLAANSKYLFIHNLYGSKISHFNKAQNYSFYSTLRLIGGNESLDKTAVRAVDEQVRNQVAMEYMLKLYINLILQFEYKTIKIRSLLLHIRGLKLDLDFMGPGNAELTSLVDEWLSWRETWFDSIPSIKKIKSWFDHFFVTYQKYLTELFSKYSFYLHSDSSMNVARNIGLSNADNLGYTRKGFILPLPGAIQWGKYTNLLNRFNCFEVGVPINKATIPDSVAGYLSFANELKNYNQKYLPHFLPLTSSLKA